MKRELFALSVLALCFLCGMAEEKNPRETTEWCEVWVSSANQNDKPRVLMVGDSITKGYFKTVEKKVGRAAYCSKFATSACIADPAFHQQLELVLSQYPYDVIHFNNGLHGAGYDIGRYEQGYRKALETVKRLAPSARIVLVLSTPLNPDCDTEQLARRVDDRNRVVEKLAEEYGLEINDLYSISKGHPEYYTDAFHYKPNAIELQGSQVAAVLGKVLEGRK